jgi:hypothetical protein
MDTSGSARQAQLQSMKLRAIVTEHLGVPAGASLVAAPSFGLGAGLIVSDEAWVLLSERAAGGLGPALAWARQSGFPDRVGTLHVLAEESTGVLARRAARFSPPVRVWRVDGRSIVPATPAPVEPVRRLDERHDSLRALIVAGGAIPVEEHGVLVGEVHGLEVCRVTDGPDRRDGAPRLEVGVGAHDRELFALVHGDVPTIDALAGVVAAVAGHRSPGAEPHPLNRIGAERALRAALIADPALVGARVLRPGQPPVARVNVKDAVPCVAIGESADGPVVVVCSTGVDLDVVPFAVDAWLTNGDERAEIVIAVPARDRLAVTAALAGWTVPPASLVGL